MFKDNLVSLRKMHGFSQDELSEKIGVSRQTLSKYETGESLPDIEKCKLLAEVLDVSLDDLVNYDRENSNDLGLGVPPKESMFWNHESGRERSDCDTGKSKKNI